jgi:adenylosuccinate lyase
MIERYCRPEMTAIWSEENKFRTWLEVEIAFVEVMEELGRFPSGVASRVRKNASFDIDGIKKREETLKHDVIAFLSEVSSTLGDDGRYLHWGMTSSDLLDTALAYQIKAAGKHICAGVDRLQQIVKNLAVRYKSTPIIGRSHGVHAEPTTFGLKMLVWYEELMRADSRITLALEEAAAGKLSGAVGTFSYLDPEVEEKVCVRLGLDFARVSTQIVQRDRLANLLAAFAILASSLEKFATEIRHLQRTEVREVEEPFSKGQRGSSAMPHKKNPVNCERVSGLARLVRAHAVAALENVSLWHERDISHSSVERVIVPDSFFTIDFMLSSLGDVLEGLVVHEDQMLKNISLAGGLVFSQKVLLALTEKGLSRDKAYDVVQRCAMRAWDGEGSFQEFVSKEQVVRERLSADELQACFDIHDHLRNVDKVFERVLAREG